MTFAPHHVDHVGIAVRNVAAAIATWETLVDLPLSHEEVLEDLNVRLAYLDAGNIDIQLVAPLTPSGFIHDHLETHGEGLHHLCFTVDDIPVVLEPLDEATTPVHMGGRQRRICFLGKHPPGVMIELTERHPYRGGVVSHG